MSRSPFRITAEVTSNLVASGEWIGVCGYVIQDGLPTRLAEVWLLINGKYVKCMPQTCWHERFWFHCRFGIGRYRIQAEAYKVMEERMIQTEKGPVRTKREHKLKTSPLAISVLPKILNPNRMLPRTYEVENWRRITLAEGMALARKAKGLMLKRYPDTSRIMLVGGVVDRGWSRRDVDLLLISPSLYEEYRVKGERIPYRPYGSKETYSVIKTRLEDWRDLSFEKEVERRMAYPATVMVTEDERVLQASRGMEI